MKQVLNRASRQCLVGLMAALLLLPTVSFAKAYDEDPSAGAMVMDAVVARPLLMVLTVAGTGLYIITLPFSLAAGTAGEAGEELVVGPAKAAFVRCLGCRQSGHHE